MSSGLTIDMICPMKTML